MSKKGEKGNRRERANSVISAKEILKRKRELEDPEEFERWELEQLKAFKKSSKTTRSPQKQQIKKGELSDSTDNEEMEEVLRKLEEVRQDLKCDLESKLTEMKQEFAGVKEELQKVKKEWEEKAKSWQKEKGEMEKRISNLENKLEKQERGKKRNNIVFKGIDFEKEQQGSQNLKQKIANFVQKEMGIEIEIEEAFKVGKPEAKVTVMTCKNFDHKIQLMKQKWKLPRGVYVDSDLTLEERKVQQAIRNVAREEKEKGKKTKVGYRKLEVDGIKYEWSQDQGGSLVKADTSKN